MSNNKRQSLIEAWTYPEVNGPLESLDTLPQGQRMPFGARIEGLSSENVLLSWGDAAYSANLMTAIVEPSQWKGELLVGDIVRCTGILEGNKLTLETIELLVPTKCEQPFKKNFGPLKLRLWSEFTHLIRNFFLGKNFLEARTPTLVSCPGTEPFLNPFQTEFVQGKTSKIFYLPTSPELHLKKLLCLGHSKIFEMKECFRNGEISNHHQPEFLMLEWYRAFSNLKPIKEDLIELLHFLAKKLGVSMVPLTEHSFSELFQKRFEFKLTPETSYGELANLAEQLGVDFNSSYSWEDLFHAILLSEIEPDLGPGPVILYNYPPQLAAYARINQEGWADRFEFYWKGLEIANAFHELNDPTTQKHRMESDNEKKKLMDLQELPLDQQFLKALEWGMPPSGGIALGVERLFMAFYDLEFLDLTRPFPMDEETGPSVAPP